LLATTNGSKLTSMSAPEAASAQVEVLVRKFRNMNMPGAACRRLNEHTTRQGFIRHTLKRRIQEVNSEVDRRAYELYEVTDDEIALVEGTK